MRRLPFGPGFGKLRYQADLITIELMNDPELRLGLVTVSPQLVLQYIPEELHHRIEIFFPGEK